MWPKEDELEVRLMLDLVRHVTGMHFADYESLCTCLHCTIHMDTWTFWSTFIMLDLLASVLSKATRCTQAEAIICLLVMLHASPHSLVCMSQDKQSKKCML